MMNIEYKVVSIDENVEDKLNELSKHGWRVAVTFKVKKISFLILKRKVRTE